MKLKRLNHQAQNLGQMFCGWELMFDYKRLAELGSGILTLNILTKECQNNENSIPPLQIASTLNHRMTQDLAAHGIELEAIEVASLEVEFKTERHKGQKGDTSWADPTPYYIGCTLSCSSKIRAFGREYVSTYVDAEEWPESYSWCKEGHSHPA